MADARPETRLRAAWRRAYRRRDAWLPPAACAALAALVFAAVQALRSAGRLEYLELKLYDQFVQLAPTNPAHTSPVLVVGINESDIQERAVSYPVSDTQLAELLERVLSLGPRAVGVDIYKDDAALGDRGPAAMEARRRLLSVFENHRNVVAVMAWNQTEPLIRAPEGVPPEQVGFADLPEDRRDGVIRRHWFYQSLDDGGEILSLAARLALLYLGDGADLGFKEGQPDAVGVGKATIQRIKGNEGGYHLPANEVAGNWQFLLDYKGRTFTHVSASDVLRGKVRPDQVKDKAVLVGMTADSVKDYVATPVNYKAFGVDAHAIAVDQLIRMATMGQPPPGSWTDAWETVWLAAWTALGGALGYRVRSTVRFVFLLALGIALIVLLGYRQYVMGYWVPVLPPVLGFAVAAALGSQYMSFAERDKRMLMAALTGPLLSQKVIDLIWDSRDSLLEEGRPVAQQGVFTVLFADLRGFSGTAERMEPQAVMDWLTQYLAAMADLVEARDGVVIKYMGDGFMAVFGAPVVSGDPASQKRDAVNAVDCALDMRRELARLARGWRTSIHADVCMRIGIYTGLGVSGTVGSVRRMEYTVLGDTVNVASRLESLKKEMMSEAIAEGGCRIFAGGPTVELLDGLFVVDLVGEELLAGRRERVPVYAVKSRRAAPAAV